MCVDLPHSMRKVTTTDDARIQETFLIWGYAVAIFAVAKESRLEDGSCVSNEAANPSDRLC
jgi:hypothetical protein